ncbi:hypothetical protein HBI31_244630 [Parastagonospora nodorum]|nr:hypothetical protein HBI31_244630 [Parastagonospora nodorum]KAH6284831.1 hypothetical protein HBI39_244570 [Parastagonospora nodorum]KAH6384074.1 hypothetical protein HBI60_247940 [Parastagonospora nodorum]
MSMRGNGTLNTPSSNPTSSFTFSYSQHISSDVSAISSATSAIDTARQPITDTLSSTSTSTSSEIVRSNDRTVLRSTATLPALSQDSSASRTLLPPPGINPPPIHTTNFFPGMGIETSASIISRDLIDMFGLLDHWIDVTEAPQATAVALKLDIVLPRMTDFLHKLPKPPQGPEPCKRADHGQSELILASELEVRSLFGGLFKTAFSLVACVIETAQKLRTEVTKGVKDTLDVVKSLEKTLKPMVDALNDVDPDGDPKSSPASDKPTSKETERSTSASCSMRTASECKVECAVTATTTLGAEKRRAEGKSCTTTCEAPITSCGATGSTSTSTITSTITTFQPCNSGCAKCKQSLPDFPMPTPDVVYSTAPNGVYYVPATRLGSRGDSGSGINKSKSDHRSLTQRANRLQARSLPNPHGDFRGDIVSWLVSQLLASPNRLPQGDGPSGTWTTGFSHPLLDIPNTFNLIDLWGCTSVIVISRKRVFMTHIWEQPSMMSPHLFEQDIAQPLRDGGDWRVPRGLSFFTGPGGDFENTAENNVRAFIITSYRRSVDWLSEDDLQYVGVVGNIKELLHDILGRRDTMTIPYEARGPETFLKAGVIAFPNGKVLIQYDPVEGWLSGGPDACDIQAAKIELWFERSPFPRYSDQWEAFPSQFPRWPWPGQLDADSGEDTELLEFYHLYNGTEEEKLNKYKDHLKLQMGDSCPLRSKSAVTSSTKFASSFPASSISSLSWKTVVLASSLTSSVDNATGTTLPSISSSLALTVTASTLALETKNSQSFMLSETTWTGSEMSTAITYTHSSTAIAQSSSRTSVSTSTTTITSASPPPLPPPPPPPTPSKKVSIMLRQLIGKDENYNSWTFFPSQYSVIADGCSVPSLNDLPTRWLDQNAIKFPPFPHGLFALWLLFDEWDCVYQSDGTNAGFLHCPSMGEEINVRCKEDKHKSDVNAVTDCHNSKEASILIHRVARCEW